MNWMFEPYVNVYWTAPKTLPQSPAERPSDQPVHGRHGCWRGHVERR
jgi:hypothetical protein